MYISPHQSINVLNNTCISGSYGTLVVKLKAFTAKWV